MHSVVVCPPPLRLPRCLAAPSPPVSLSRLLVTSPPRLLGSSTLASSFTGCVALLLSALLPALLATLLFALTASLSAPVARRRPLRTSCCAALGSPVFPVPLLLARTAGSPFPFRSVGVCPGVLRLPLRDPSFLLLLLCFLFSHFLARELARESGSATHHDSSLGTESVPSFPPVVSSPW